ncbi:hypothetical protein NGRA_2902 [Nosema granulosis]|uniref:CCHC-type domain-containing protein n=1 Tax=Nosema granulosis TaxID=83296 RepID=A0A9P6GWV0_9MICR|nr:hypothetical protein NGRA_2902 [Nosema granulosis]
MRRREGGESIATEIANRLVTVIREHKRRSTRCYNCSRFGHKTYSCYFRYKNNKVKDVCYSSRQDGSSSVEEMSYMRIWDSKRQKKQIVEEWKRDVRDDVSCDLEMLKKKFKKLLNNDEEVIEHCEVVKCKIKTQDCKKVCRKGQIIPQALMKATEDYINSLEITKMIRRFNSDWRKPIRTIEKPDGGVRLVSNLMALNDIAEMIRMD